uniref:Uncharacterized protein n=1 Tax=Leersia perrieri TaxID=77586 RepID=A0A0D9W9H0_9ORYZ
MSEASKSLSPAAMEFLDGAPPAVVYDYDSGSGSGRRKRKRERYLMSSLEYPCVSRLRHRRLLAFLRRNDYKSTFDALVEETRVYLRVWQLQELVRQGRWPEAVLYVWRFVPSSHLLSDAGKVFLEFIHIHEVIHSILIGDPHGANVAERYERHIKEYPDAKPGIVKIGRILLAIIRSPRLRSVTFNEIDRSSSSSKCLLSFLIDHRSPGLVHRASIDWSLVRIKAAEMIKDLVDKAPDFNDLRKLPSLSDKPHNILPVGSCFHRRRHAKTQGRIPASDIARLYLQKKRGLPSSNLRPEAGESVRAGMQGCRFKNSGNEAMMRPLTITATGQQGFNARYNPTRPVTTAQQEINPTTQHTAGEFVQVRL